MIEVIHFQRTKPDTAENTAEYQITFECDRKGMDKLLEIMKLEQAKEVHNHMTYSDVQIVYPGTHDTWN